MFFSEKTREVYGWFAMHGYYTDKWDLEYLINDVGLREAIVRCYLTSAYPEWDDWVFGQPETKWGIYSSLTKNLHFVPAEWMV